MEWTRSSSQMLMKCHVQKTAGMSFFSFHGIAKEQ